MVSEIGPRRQNAPMSRRMPIPASPPASCPRTICGGRCQKSTRFSRYPMRPQALSKTQKRCSSTFTRTASDEPFGFALILINQKTAPTRKTRRSGPFCRLRLADGGVNARRREQADSRAAGTAAGWDAARSGKPAWKHTACASFASPADGVCKPGRLPVVRAAYCRF